MEKTKDVIRFTTIDGYDVIVLLENLLAIERRPLSVTTDEHELAIIVSFNTQNKTYTVKESTIEQWWDLFKTKEDIENHVETT